MRSRSNNKKIIIIGGIILLIILLGGLLYFILTNNKKTISKDNNTPVEETKKEESNKTKEIYYVSCDDNTSLLNVRDSVTGNVIDGLSCYKEVAVEDANEKTDTCDKWYKINYTKNNNHYEGYACANYIKKSTLEEVTYNKVKEIVNKLTTYYSDSSIKVYCGNSTGTKTINFENNITGEYTKSEYKSLEELKNYLLTFLDSSLLIDKLELSDINNPKYLDNYYEIDNNLYCRNYSAKGISNRLTNNYNFEVLPDNDTIKVNVSYEYLKEESKCNLNELSKCSNSDFKYQIKKLTIKNNIVTKIEG